MSPEELDQRIRDYLSGKHSPEGEHLFNAWYKSHADKTSPLAGLNQAEKEQVRREIFAKIKPTIQSQKITKPSALFILNMPRRWYRWAAVWSGLILLGIASFFYVQYQRETTSVQTVFGEIKTVMLPDGSEVTLNANSSLQYKADWNETPDRQVWLNGEAFFSVVHTSDNRKFQVHTSHLNVEVLGTEFNARSRGDNAEVVLHSGKVKLAFNPGDSTTDVVMKPGELLAYSESDQRITRKVVTPHHYSSWRHHELILNNTSLAEIARALENYYGYEVKIQNKQLKQKKLTATAQLSLQEKDVILKAISEIYGIKVIQDGNKILFRNP